MALATESNGRHLSVEPAPAAWSTGVDRSRAFARAKRHSLIVRWLKVILPICAVAVLSSYALFMQRSIDVGGGGKLELGPVAFSSDVLTMHNPRYEGYGKDGTRFSVAARSAEQDIQQDGPIRLNTIEGTIVQPNNTKTTLQATRGVFDSEANELELLDSIEIKSSDGMTARLTRAMVFMKESKIVSNDPVTVEMATGTLAGNSMVLLQKTKELTFADGVTARLKPQSRPKAGQTDQPHTMASLIGSGDAPVDVTAPTLTVNDERKTAVFSGNVRVEQDGSALTARELEVIYDGGGSADAGSEPAPAVPGTAAAGRVKRILARDDVVLTRGNDRVTSAAAEFDTVAETSILTGGVTFSSGPDQRAVADRAELDFKAETVLLTGAVAVSQGPNRLEGRRLFLDQKNGTMQLNAPALAGVPAGRIAARFQQPNPRTRRAETAPDGDAGGWRFRTDPNAPIEIEADVLDVDDKARTATFRGDVVAVQGDFRIRTVELVATYTGQAGAQLMQQPADPNAKAPAAQLQRVQARRKVVVTSKDDQSATGDWADFDVKANTVVLGGDVTLTQGRNVVRGPRLVIDMTTGLSRMETRRPSGAQTAGSQQQKGAPSTANPSASRGGNAPTAKGWPAGACGGRMCAVFYPEDAKALAERRKAESAPRPDKSAQPKRGDAASSWSSTTIPAGEPE